jgi:hypothetical protein
VCWGAKAVSVLDSLHTGCGAQASICWLSAGVLYWNFASDPRTVHQERMKRRRQGAVATSSPRSLHDLLQDAKSCLTVPSFQIIASQGVVGTLAAWQAASMNRICNSCISSIQACEFHTEARVLAAQAAFQGTRWRS